MADKNIVIKDKDVQLPFIKNMSKDVENEMLKLVDDYLSLGGNFKIKKTKEVQKYIQGFIRKHYGTHEYIEYVKALIEIDLVPEVKLNYATMCDIAKPFIEKLYKDPDWDLSKIRFVLRFITYCIDLEMATELSKRFIETLDRQYSQEAFYALYKTCLHLNLTFVYLRVYSQSFNALSKTPFSKDSEKDLNNLKEGFQYNLDLALSLSQKNGLGILHAASLFRKGLFDEDEELIEKSLKMVNDLGEKYLVTLLRHEQDNYNFYMSKEVGQYFFKDCIARALIYHLEATGHTVEEVAKYMEVPPGAIIYLLTGEGRQFTLSAYNLYQMARFFNKSLDEYLAINNHVEKTQETATDSSNPIVDNITEMLKKLPNPDLDAITYIVKTFIKKDKK